MTRLTRLKKRAEFLRMAQKGKKVVTPGLIGQVTASADSCEMRVGFTVTKKVGNAVIRNRVKRRLKEASRLVMGERESLSGVMVLIGRHQTIGRPFDSLKQDVRKALKTMNESRNDQE